MDETTEKTQSATRKAVETAQTGVAIAMLGLSVWSLYNLGVDLAEATIDRRKAKKDAKKQ